ncbi:MAG TPA: chemotaxis protein CheX [Candidatus Hydrogenedentes bacterium]|nr:chemotaxis protein CheX [Candidatus Hydrogenedentota bacterium]
MSNELNQAKHVFSRVAEDLVFMFSEEWDEEDRPATEEAFVLARIRFTGPFNGALSLAAPESLCKQVKENMLGARLEEGIGGKYLHDAFGELLNVTCGHLLTALAGDDPVFNLAPPEIVVLDRTGWEKFKSMPGITALLLEDMPVLLHFEQKG